MFALRVRNTKSRNRLIKLERYGGVSEDRSKSLDLDHSNYEVLSRRPSVAFRVRIGGSAFDVNNHFTEIVFKKYLNIIFFKFSIINELKFKLFCSKLFVETFKNTLYHAGFLQSWNTSNFGFTFTIAPSNETWSNFSDRTIISSSAKVPFNKSLTMLKLSYFSRRDILNCKRI